MDAPTGSAEPWLLATYQPVALFSLKSALATSSGGKTVLVPTPFSIKMALLDAALRLLGVEQGQRVFPLVRDLRIALRVPQSLVVINSFGKVRRPWEAPKQKGADRAAAEERARSRATFPWNTTIAYREYVQFGGPLHFAFNLPTDPDAALPIEPSALLSCVNYLGRRGGFVQLAEPPTLAEGLPDGYRVLTDEAPSGYADGWLLQVLDDCGPTLTFEQANIYSAEKITLGKGRVLRHVPLPLRLARSSRGFSLYERIDT